MKWAFQPFQIPILVRVPKLIMEKANLWDLIPKRCPNSLTLKIVYPVVNVPLDVPGIQNGPARNM